MKYKALFNDVDFLKEDNLLHTLLKNRGVENPDKLLNITIKEVYDGKLLKNMDKALKILNKWLSKAKQELVVIHVIVDEDCDGYTSASEVINYIKDIVEKDNLKVEITYTVHSKKIHGIELKELKDIDFNLLIVPDAGTNDVEQCREIKKKYHGCDIIILDHHNIEKENNYATVVNCKDGTYPNPTLSGAGVVYKFIKEYDNEFDYNFADKYLDLFATGNIGDIMDLRNLETRFLTLEGIKNFAKNNLFLQEILEKNSYQIGERLNITKVGWNIVPTINAVTRVGEPEERLKTFKALLGEKDSIEYKPRKSKNNPNPEVEMQSLQKFMARECGNIKNRQDRIAKKGVEELSRIIEENGYNEDKVIIVDATKLIEKDFTGLIANKLSSKYRRPVLVLKSMNKEIFGGSGRNYGLSPIENFNDFLQGTNLFVEVAGHDNSFGIKINKWEYKKLIAKSRKIKKDLIKTKYINIKYNKKLWINKLRNDHIDRARKYINEKLKDIVMEDVYKVDYEIPIGRLKPQHVLQVGSWVDLWGNKLNEPLFAITDVYVTSDNIKLLGEKKSLIKLETRDLTFVKQFANEDLYNQMILRNSKGLNKRKNNRLRFDFVCKFTINEWNDKKYPQIEIVDFNVREDSSIRF